MRQPKQRIPAQGLDLKEQVLSINRVTKVVKVGTNTLTGGEERLAEAAKQGFRQAIVPSANLPRGRKIPGLDVRAARTLSEALSAI